MAVKPSVVSVSFPDSGLVLSSFLSLQLSESFTDPLDSCRFEVDGSPSRISEIRSAVRKGDPCRVMVDGKPQAYLMVSDVTTTVGKDGGVVVGADCVSPIALLQESDAESSLSKVLDSDAPVQDLVLDAVQPYGFDAIVSDDDVGAIRSKTGKGSSATKVNVEALKASDTRVQPNEKVYAFIQRIISRLGVIMRMGPQGEILLTRPHYDGSVLYTLVLAGAESGAPSGVRFVGPVVERDSNRGQASFCEVLGARSDKSGETTGAPPKSRVESAEINPTRPPFRASSRYTYKPRYIRDASCRDIDRAASMARFALGLRAENAYSVKGRVEGLTGADGTPLTVDTLARVHVGPIGLDETLWISSRTFTLSKSGGQFTDLVLIPPGNLTLGDA